MTNHIDYSVFFLCFALITDKIFIHLFVSLKKAVDNGGRGFAVLRYSSIFRAVLQFLPIFLAVFVRFGGFNSSLRFAFSHQILVRLIGFWPF